MAQEDVAPIRVGLLGAGTVGSQTARLLVEQKDELAARIGRPIELTGVACLDPAETDPFPWIDKAIVTTDTMSVATNSDIVIELIGGTGVARKFVLAAIESGASVVTANKALLAKYGPEIYAAAEAKGVDIYFEASVGGAIPFLKPLRESLVGDKVTSMLGIVNGTTNYILDEMTTKGLDFDDVLKDAQAKATPKPIRPATSRLRRGQQGRDHGHPRLPHLRHHRRRLRRGHHQDHRRRHRRRHRGKQGDQAARRRGEHRCRRVRARLPGTDLQHPSAGLRARLLQRRVRQGRSRGRPHVLRPRAGGAPTAPRSSETS